MSRILKSKKTAGLIASAVVVLCFPLFVGQAGYFLSLGMKIGTLALFAMSYNLLLGYTGIVSLGHALFFGLGGYTSAILMLKLGWPLVATLLPTILFCIAVALAIGFLTLRVKDIYFTMLTLALGQLFFVAVSKAYNLTGGEDGLPGIPGLFANKTLSYYAIMAILFACYVLLRKFTTSPFGRVLQAIRENEMRTGMIGYNVLVYKLIVLSLSGVLAGISGCLYVTYSGIVYPALTNAEMTMQVIFMAIIGGTGTLYGPILGALIVTVISTILNNFTNRWLLIFGIIFVLFIMFLPEGVSGLIQSTLARKKKKTIPSDSIPELVDR